MPKRIITLLFVLLFAIPVAAGFSVNKKGIPKRPQNSYVYDEDRLLSKQEVQFFNALAEELYKKAKVGLAVALVHDIGFADFRDSRKLGCRWKKRRRHFDFCGNEATPQERRSRLRC